MAVALSRYGLTWGDLVLNGLRPTTVGAGPMGFWAKGRPGMGRTRTAVHIGQCAGGADCDSRLKSILVYALRHNEDTNGPFGFDRLAARISTALPMWVVKQYVRRIDRAHTRSTSDADAGPSLLADSAWWASEAAASLAAELESSSLYQEYLAVVNENVFAEFLAALVAEQAELGPDTEAEIETLFALLSAPEHFMWGLVQLEHIPDYSIDPLLCPLPAPLK